MDLRKSCPEVGRFPQKGTTRAARRKQNRHESLLCPQKNCDAKLVTKTSERVGLSNFGTTMPVGTFIENFLPDPDDDRGKDMASFLAAGSRVRELQETFFPVKAAPSVNPPGGFFMNLLMRPDALTEEDEIQQMLARKESKELFAVVKDFSSTMQPARWPIECQVITDRIKHICYAPSIPEPYYTRTGREIQPKPVGEELGIIVYQHYPISAMNYFSRSSTGGCRFLLPTCPAPENDSLRFESRFESGNLAKVIKVSSVYYELYLRNDLYTNKHMQWFYFRVSNMKKNLTYRFSIVNMTKDGSLFNQGMRPVLYSTKDAQLHNIGWRRCGNSVTYFCNNDSRERDSAQQDDEDTVHPPTTNTLTFTLDFPHDSDLVYLAYTYPYTYSDLQDYLLEISKHPIKSKFTTLRLLCRSLAGNNLYYLTITNQGENKKKKKAIVLTARVHPGEAPSSWMMKGVLDFLTSDSGPARELRSKFIFKIIPMLNPDGVIVGNTRCSLSGRDLNRQYRTVIREMYPPVWYAKLMIRRLMEDCGVVLYCDFHAHSRKHNIFMYGCENNRSVTTKLYEQVLPLMLHKNAPDKFSFENCHFRLKKNKEGTGRVVSWVMGIEDSYTIEASFGGSMMGSRSETHFSVQDYENMGRSFCETLLDYYDMDPRKNRLREKIVERLLSEGSNACEPTNIPLSDYSSDDGETTSTSDEVGRDDYRARALAPPPSPILVVKRTSKKSKSTSKKKTLIIKNPNCLEPRKTYQANLDFSSDSGEASEAEKRLSKKKQGKKSGYSPFVEVENRSPIKQSLSLLELGSDQFQPFDWTKIIPPPKVLADSAKDTRNLTKQLSQVHIKLADLKSRLWSGSGEPAVNAPLSWGPSRLSGNMVKPSTADDVYLSRQGNVNKMKSEKTKVDKKFKGAREVDDNGNALKDKKKSAKKKCVKKPHVVIQWLPADEFLTKVDTVGFKKPPDPSKKPEESKKKSGGGKKHGGGKKGGGLQKKAALVSNVKTFITKKD